MRFALLSLASLLAFSLNSFASEFVTRLDLATGISELQNPDGSWQVIDVEGPGGGRPTLGDRGVTSWHTDEGPAQARGTSVVWIDDGRGIRPYLDDGRDMRPHLGYGRGIKPIAYVPGVTPLMYYGGAYIRPSATYAGQGYLYFAWQP